MLTLTGRYVFRDKLMYILEMSLLQKGDVILTAERACRSKGVRISMWSKFSHAVLYVSSGSYIHSDSKGVHADNIQRLLFKSKNHVAVLRPYKSKYIDVACVFARTQIGKQYSVKEAIRTKKNLLLAKEQNRQFCSRLVAQSYADAGLNISRKIDYCTPKDIYKSSEFHEIKTCIRKANEEEIDFAQRYNPLEAQKQITNSILSYAREIAGCDIQTFEQLTDLVVSTPSIDTQIADFMTNSGYFDMWRNEYQKNRWRYDYKTLISLNVDEATMIKTCQREVENASERLKLYSFSLVQYKMSFSNVNLKYIQKHIELYENLVQMAKENLHVCSQYLRSKT
ncbi:YiiX/YebB-like N1pC/P60 family cysteine hydrolase [Photobacterium carnosum]|uniref:YiiX/YebB-like N1pC/P60 family cysteine hydrolase n=1 Tax=Photobacterium carnosum TaxID=2023717 RepID=UPI002FCCD3E1